MQTQAHGDGISSCGVSCVQFSPTYHSSGTEKMTNPVMYMNCMFIIRVKFLSFDFCLEIASGSEFLIKCLNLRYKFLMVSNFA